MPKPKRFKANVERFEGAGTWTYANIPFDCEKELGSRGRIRVKGTINGTAIEAALMPHGDGSHFIILTKEIRDKAKIKVGDTITVSLEKDDEKKEIAVPGRLLKELKKNKAAREYFESLPPSHRKEYIKWIEEAKKEETRLSRIAKAIGMLTSGNKLK
jgi:bifunctional DNA-binding transcriptional regulator/antitoxin component of YhaV-PrlF toxin-antitoxin module